jgi:multimeric flavodoxin WrbA
MSKKVLVISSSPRKNGNSDLLCNQFIAGAENAGHIAEKISLREKTINYCTGCGTCIRGNNGCRQKDDAAEILEKMVEADVIVMATPVYFYSMSAQMKALIDRTCARYTEISNKEFYFIVTAADSNRNQMERTIEGFRGFTSYLTRSKEKGIIYGLNAWEMGEIKKNSAMAQAYEMGKEIS